MADWSKLPNDLLCMIALKLDFAPDLVHFGAVCSSWRYAYLTIKVFSTATTSVPLLLLPENTKENPNHVRKIFFPGKGRCYELKLPETFGARCWGTSSGWIVTFDLTLELHVFNPFTRVRIRLPPQSTMPNKRFDKIEDLHWLRQKYVDKVYVFDVHDDGDFVVVALHGGPFNSQLAFARPSDESWTQIYTLRRCVHDVVRRGTQLIVVFERGDLAYCDSTFQKSQPATVMRKELPTPPIENSSSVPFKRFYLLEYGGNLLYVYRFKQTFRSKSCHCTEDMELYYRTKGFEVYLFDFDTKSWMIVEDLGDVALFVGNNCSMIANVSATNNLKRNSIYFSDDETILWLEPTLYGGHDMGIYDLEKKEIQSIYEGGDIHSAFCPAVWFVPKFPC